MRAMPMPEATPIGKNSKNSSLSIFTLTSSLTHQLDTEIGKHRDCNHQTPQR